MAVTETVKSSPGELGAVSVWGALTGLLTVFGVNPTKALAISGMAAALTPTIVKAFKAWRHK